MFTPFRLFVTLILSAAAISVCTALTPVPQTMTGGEVEAKFRGEWVPAKARCTRR